MPSPDLLRALWLAQPCRGLTLTTASGLAHHHLWTSSSPLGTPGPLQHCSSSTSSPFFPFNTSRMVPMPQVCHMSIFHLCHLSSGLCTSPQCVLQSGISFSSKDNLILEASQSGFRPARLLESKSSLHPRC